MVLSARDQRVGEGFEMTEAGKRFLAPSCTKCARFATCVIYRNAARFLAAEFPPLPDGTPTAPYKAEETAKICVYYTPPTPGEITV